MEAKRPTHCNLWDPKQTPKTEVCLEYHKTQGVPRLASQGAQKKRETNKRARKSQAATDRAENVEKPAAANNQ